MDTDHIQCLFLCMARLDKGGKDERQASPEESLWNCWTETHNFLCTVFSGGFCLFFHQMLQGSALKEPYPERLSAKYTPASHSENTAELSHRRKPAQGHPGQHQLQPNHRGENWVASMPEFSTFSA